MHLALVLPEPYRVHYAYIFLLFIININLHEGDNIHPHGMRHRRPNESDAPRKRSHAVSDLQEGALMAAYRMFPPVGPDRADELAAGDTRVGFGPDNGDVHLGPNVRRGLESIHPPGSPAPATPIGPQHERQGANRPLRFRVLAPWPPGVAMHGAWAPVCMHGRSPPLRPGLPADHGVVRLPSGRWGPSPTGGAPSGVGDESSRPHCLT
jgi:hypothetical protein